LKKHDKTKLQCIALQMNNNAEEYITVQLIIIVTPICAR